MRRPVLFIAVAVLLALLGSLFMPVAYAWVQAASYALPAAYGGLDIDDPYVAVAMYNVSTAECYLVILSADNLSSVSELTFASCAAIRMDLYGDIVAIAMQNASVTPGVTNVYIYNITSGELLSFRIESTVDPANNATWPIDVDLTDSFVVVTVEDEGSGTYIMHFAAINGTLLGYYDTGSTEVEVSHVDNGGNMIMFYWYRYAADVYHVVLAEVLPSGTLNFIHEFDIDSINTDFDAVYDPTSGVVYLFYDDYSVGYVDVYDLGTGTRINLGTISATYILDADLTPLGNFLICTEYDGVFRYVPSENKLYQETVPTDGNYYYCDIGSEKVVYKYQTSIYLYSNLGGSVTTVTETVTETVTNTTTQTQVVYQYETETETTTLTTTVQGHYTEADLLLVGIIAFFLAVATVILVRR